MTTTCMRDSIVGDAWIQQTAAAVPVQRVVDEKTGNFTGDILTGPVRLAFDTLFDLPKATESSPNPKYGAAMLFTPFADFSIFYEAYYEVCARSFPQNYDRNTGQYYGLHSPFRDQGEKARFGGFTPGCIFMSCTSKFKPPVIDAFGKTVTDKARVYPGVWAICSVNPYAFNDPKKKGVAFGLQSVMLIGDDTKFGGGAPDPNQTFSGVKGAISAPSIPPGALSHLAGQTGQPPQGMPGQPQGHRPPPTGAAAPPPPGGTYAPPPGAGRPMAPPGGGYTMPGTSLGDPRGPVPAGFSSWAEYDDLMG